jgi:hypothetical protein
MAEKDITEKMLEDYNDVFADIVNVLLFNGEEVVKQDSLENSKDKSMIKIDGKIHEQERDVSKYWTQGKVKLAIYGLENQSTVDKDMPLRIMGYDGAAYKKELLDDDKKEARYPVITLVLYFGTERWKNTRLYDCFDVPDNLKPFVSNYKINVFEIAYLSEETVNKFTSDFRMVADYFVQSRKTQKYNPPESKIKHVDEFLKLMSKLSNDETWEDCIKKTNPNDKEGLIMSSLFKEKVQEGVQIGEKKGEKKGEIKVYYSEMGLSNEEIAKRLSIPVKEVEDIIASLSLVP